MARWFSGEHRGWSDKGHVFNSPTNKNNISQFKIKILMKLGEGLFNGKITKHLI